jgi:tungstate transport system permease protein
MCIFSKIQEEGMVLQSALEKALQLILSADKELCNILEVTAKLSISSSLIALLIGVPIGIWLGTTKFKGQSILLVLNRTLMGMPPVVCGLLFYMLFSGVGPFRHMKLLFTVDIMILAQVVLITPIVIGNMETYVAGIAEPVRETAKGLGIGAGKMFLLFGRMDLLQIVLILDDVYNEHQDLIICLQYNALYRHIHHESPDYGTQGISFCNPESIILS